MASWNAEHEPRGRHGIPIAEATDPDARFTVDLPSTDFAQRALDRAKDAYKKQYGDTAEMDSLLWRVRPAEASG